MYLPCQTRRSGWAGLMVPPSSIMSVINGHLENNKMNKSIVIPCPPSLRSWGKQGFLSVRGPGWAATAQAAERPDPVISGCQPRSSPLQALTEHPRSRSGAAEPPHMGLGRWAFRCLDRKRAWQNRLESGSQGAPCVSETIGSLCRRGYQEQRQGRGAAGFSLRGWSRDSEEASSQHWSTPRGKAAAPKQGRISPEESGDAESDRRDPGDGGPKDFTAHSDLIYGL